MELTNTEGLRSVVWPSKEEYSRLKSGYIKNILPQALDALDTSVQTRSLSVKEKAIGAGLISNFFWGAKMASVLFGYEGELPELILRPESRTHYVGIEYQPANNEIRFVINTTKFKKIVRNMSKETLAVSFEEPPFVKGLKPKHNFELAGVEEMAHFFFIKTKKHVGTPALFGSGSESLDYRSSDIEERAIIWKSGYTKHYMPKYYEGYSGFIDEIRKFRLKR